ncbi:MAG: hypothetical protein ACREPA_11485 [Candidatus Dormibacteraceae bacterium]
MHLKRRVLMLAVPASMLAGIGSIVAFSGPTLASAPVAAVNHNTAAADKSDTGTAADAPETGAGTAGAKADPGGAAGPDVQQGAQYDGQFEGQQ